MEPAWVAHGERQKGEIVTADAEAPPIEAPGLSGTTWQLVEFRGGDDTKLTPDDRSKYTIALGTDASVAVRFDCNRGRGTWKSSRSSLEFGPMALTRAACPPASLHDRLVSHFPLIRSYVIKRRTDYASLKTETAVWVAAADPRPQRDLRAALMVTASRAAVRTSSISLRQGPSLHATSFNESTI